MNSVTINGKTYFGNSVSIVDDTTIIIDGVKVDDKKLPKNILTIKVVGILGTLKTDKSVICQDVTGNISAGGSVNANGVGGDIAANGSVNCDEVSGSVHAGGSVNCDDVGGNVTAGGSIRRG